MAVMNGTAVLVTVGGEEINLLTECSISLTTELRDITNKSSGGFKQSLAGLRSGSINFSSLHDEAEDSDAVQKLQDLWTTWSSDTVTASINFTTETSGDYEFSASGWITSLEINAGTEDNVTISGTIEMDGTITYTAIT